MSVKETTENYLETIYMISLTKENVRSIDICEALNFSRPTISIAMKKLLERGYINIKNNIITLTKEGLDIALKVYERHKTLSQFLQLIGVDQENANNDACLIEHDLSSQSYEAIKKLLHKLEKN